MGATFAIRNVHGSLRRQVSHVMSCRFCLLVRLACNLAELGEPEKRICAFFRYAFTEHLADWLLSCPSFWLHLVPARIAKTDTEVDLIFLRRVEVPRDQHSKTPPGPRRMYDGTYSHTSSHPWECSRDVGGVHVLRGTCTGLGEVHVRVVQILQCLHTCRYTRRNSLRRTRRVSAKCCRGDLPPEKNDYV